MANLRCWQAVGRTATGTRPGRSGRARSLQTIIDASKKWSKQTRQEWGRSSAAHPRPTIRRSADKMIAQWRTTSQSAPSAAADSDALVAHAPDPVYRINPLPLSSRIFSQAAAAAAPFFRFVRHPFCSSHFAQSTRGHPYMRAQGQKH